MFRLKLPMGSSASSNFASTLAPFTPASRQQSGASLKFGDCLFDNLLHLECLQQRLIDRMQYVEGLIRNKRLQVESASGNLEESVRASMNQEKAFKPPYPSCLRGLSEAEKERRMKKMPLLFKKPEVPGNSSKNKMSTHSAAPHQMQVRVTFYTIHNPQSVLMILKSDQALEQITDKARELFPSSDYRLFYGDVNGPIYEFTDSEQVMAKIRITTFSRTPQLFVRLETASACSSSSVKKTSKNEKESKSGASLKRIEQNQELTLKTIQSLQKEFERFTVMETMIADMQEKQQSSEEKPHKPLFPVKHSATCDACLGDIVGHRYKCLECADYDLCEKCEKKSVHYEHAMIRLVHPMKTIIPSYVANNSPNNVFPAYMKKNYTRPTAKESVPSMLRTSGFPPQAFVPTVLLNVDPAPAPAPAPAPVPAPAPPTYHDAKFFNEETRAALISSAALLKDTFSTLSKSFMDLADGAQAGMDKKIIERSTMEAGVTMVEEKMDHLKRHCEEKYLKTPMPEAEKKEEKSAESSEASFEPKIKKAKKKSVYKKTAEKLSATSSLRDQARADAKKRAAASTAELQRKLEKLNVKELKEDKPVVVPPVYPMLDESTTLQEIMRAILATPPHATVDTALTPPMVPAHLLLGTQNIQNAQEVPISPAPIVPVAESPVPVVPAPAEPIAPVEPTAPAEQTAPTAPTNPISIHSSFENIASDFESISSSWEDSEEVHLPRQREIDSDIEMVIAQVAEEVQPEPQPEPQQSLPAIDAQTEKTFDRLLEMGFDYNVVVSAIKTNGSDLEKCLASLLR